MKAQGNCLILDDNSTPEETEREAQWIGEEVTNILNHHAKRLRVCSRSKRWWNDEISQLRTDLGRTKRAAKHGQATRKQVAAARRLYFRAIRKAKKIMWNNFLQDTSDEDVWRATQYTAPWTGQITGTLRDEDGNEAATLREKAQMMTKVGFPPAPASAYYTLPEGGTSYSKITPEMVSQMLRKSSTKSAPGIDMIGSAALRLIW